MTVHPDAMQTAFITAVAARLSGEPRVASLFLAGSHGAGTADAFSDVDFVAVAAGADQAAVADLWRDAVQQVEPVVFWSERRGPGILLNAITESWLRCDVVIVAPDDLGRRCKAGVRVLFDRAGLYAGLPDMLPPAVPDAARVGRIIHEFIRIMGLLPVGVGRGEDVLLTKGVALLRDLLCDLMLEDCALPDRGGALHLRRLLTPDQMAVLRGLPYPGPERAAVIAAHLAVAGVFFPIARDLAARTGVVWPNAFEAALWRRLDGCGISQASAR
jgi:hypothetical protein